MNTEAPQDVPGVFDPTDPTYRADPYATYRHLLGSARVHRSVFGSPVLVRHSDCLAVLHHPNASTDETNATLYRQAVEAGLIEHDDRVLAQRPFLFLDPPDHTRLRKLVSKAFTPRRVEALRPRMHEIVARLVAAIEPGSVVDVVEAVAYPLPVQVICELLGVPVADQQSFRDWSRPLARSLDPDFALPPDVIEQRDAALANFRAYFESLIATRRESLGSDLLSALIEAEDAGDRLDEDELLSTLILLLVAGHETTVNLIANAVHTLISNPGELSRLRADVSLVPQAIEEVLRFAPPVQIDGRTFTADVEIDGLAFARGDQTVLLLAAANRDERVFPHPDRFDIGRTDNPHLSFGHGIHHCLGASLARAEGQVALEQLLAAFDTWELATDHVRFKENLVLRGLETLPVRFA